MSDYFTADFFTANRRRLRESLSPAALIVIPANGLLQRGGDSSFPFQQDGSFWYLAGIDEPDLVLVMHGEDEYIIAPVRDRIREAFDGSLSADHITGRSGIGDIVNESDGWKRLREWLKTAQEVHVLAANPVRLPTFGIYANPARRRVQEKIVRANRAVRLHDIRPEMARLRMVKQPPEVAAIRHAIDITVDTMIETFVPDRLQQFGHEYELEAALTQGFRSRGARGHAFDPIVAGGKHAATIHNLKNDAPLKAHELIVVDVGAEASHYDADITRTVAFGTPTSRQQAVYDAVLEVQKLAFGRLKPGLTIKESEQQVEQDMGVVLKQLGLITGNDRASIRTYYPHACSHSLGLDPHDAADYSLPLAPGMVITVEPGIYIPEEGIGVRLEDDVLVTDSGIAILSDRLPRTLF